MADVSDLYALLDELRADLEIAPQITAWRTLAPRPPSFAPPPAMLDERLLAALRERGIERLYSHQSQAVAQALAGRHVAIVTPTASGKTLCYNLPVLHCLLHHPQARALYLFPTKALAHDQLQTLRAYLQALRLSAVAEAYDGDTPQSRRAAIRRQARVVVSNPDMLHAGILPYHPQWAGFFHGLRYVVIDEMHTYRGIFGSHVANVLRRLRRICRFYGSEPQFICCSATIANPSQLAERLIEAPVSLVDETGAPQGERYLIFYNPPILDAQLGLRLNPLLEARRLIGRFLDRNMQTVIFCGSRLAVEQLLIYLREDAQRKGRDPNAICGYRGGYLAQERRAIEKGLRAGTVRAVVTTTALELGVDIGGLDVCIMVGYPGTIASTWQQAGRAGRGSRPSLAMLVASSSPLDQYIVKHPDYFFGQSPEHALLNPDNLYLLLRHLPCAAFELPFDESERFGSEELAPLLDLLATEGTLHRGKGRWLWVGGSYPAADVSLRSAEADNVRIVLEGDGPSQTIGQIDRGSAPRWVHEGAIYTHQGQQYLVSTLDWEGGLAYVRPVQVDYLTQASENTTIQIERVLEERQGATLALARGEVTLTRKVTSYRRLRLGTGEHLGWGDVDLPEQRMFTAAAWLMVPQHVVETLREAGWWVGDHVRDRGPNWPQQRDRARQRDGFRCQWCGAIERPGRQHHVHHLRPFREFDWRPGENDAYLYANRLENLITLCPACHQQAEQQVAVRGTLAGLGRVLSHLLPLFLMCA
ncbi:MAG: DEAD/DEAH box helicase, partial [Chloroflexi bacterium]|nr:DEAD/DEAH box helicase [Chloroflexota bacterium]